jgi:hypothetical protein
VRSGNLLSMTPEQRQARLDYQKRYRESPEGKAKRREYDEAHREERRSAERQKYLADPGWRERRKEQTKKWKRAHPQYRESDKLKAYGLSAADYSALLEKQDGVCDICRRSPRILLGGRLKALAVDHDHETGRVRGLLCDCCNRALGMLRDDVQTLKAAIRYLRRHS